MDDSAGGREQAKGGAMEWGEIYARLMRDREDACAWAALEGHVRNWARAALGRRGWRAMEEAVVDTCSAVALSLGRAHGADTFKGFAYGHFLNVRRRALQANLAPTVALEGLDVPMALAEAEGPTAEELARLRRALAELPPRERRAVTLRYLEEASAAQIGAELRVTEGNARRIVFNGLARLRRSLQRPLIPTDAGFHPAQGYTIGGRHGVEVA
jgi:RNA polymerase sigma factor (sigma-70 family)